MNENNQIDDLFRSKLRDHKTSPDAHLKEAFLLKVASQKQRKVIPIWYYASAAAILIALGFFVVTNSNSQVDAVADLQGSVNNSEKVVKREDAAVNTEDFPVVKATPQIITNSSNTVKKEVKTAVKKPSTTKPVKNNNKAITKPADIPAKPSKNAVILDEVIPDELTLAYLEAEKQEKIKTENKNLHNTDLFQKDIGETVVIIATDPAQEETIYLPELSEDSNMTLAQVTELAVEKQEKEKSFIAKVFTELKHLKHGEKVDVNTLATNINASEGFIGNEAAEFKDRWNWIKNRVSKK